MWWIWLLYAICLISIVFVSNKLGQYVDALDKKTKLSGAFLGGILLAGVTSLPELITSITAAIMGQPEMTLGNILGSNVFDLTIIGVLLIVFAKKISQKTITKGNTIICLSTLISAILIAICAIFKIQLVIPVLNINILTPIILILYALTLYFTRTDEDTEQIKDQTITFPKPNGTIVTAEKVPSINKIESLPVKKIILLFLLCSVILVGVSVAMTFIVDHISATLNMGKGIAGALFLGVATSLPEIVSTVSLVRLGNFNAGYGNILGSCLFNFAVIALSDILYFGGTVFTIDPQSLILSICLTIATAILLSFTLFRNSKSKLRFSLPIQITTGILITLCYVAFLVFSFLI